MPGGGGACWGFDLTDTLVPYSVMIGGDKKKDNNFHITFIVILMYVAL